MLNVVSIMSFAAALASCTGWEQVDFYDLSGNVSVQTTATVTTCPDMQYYAVAPLQTSVGGTLSLRVSASVDAGSMSIRWTGTGGHIVDPSASETTYVCDVAGAQKIKVTVTGRACERRQQIDVLCVKPKNRQ